MTRTFYIKPENEEVMFDFKDINQELDINYSNTIVAMMDLFISNRKFREEVLENITK
tara:strand:- start:626 stop:796 length:171 start_codon:yes stop_codon:yes gene_type:complete